MSPPHPGPVRVRSCLTTPRLPIVQAMGFIPPTQPNCQGKGLMARAHEGPLARPLGAQPTGCYDLFLFLSDGVSVGLNSGHSPCGWIVSTGLSVPGISGNFPTSLLQAARAGMGIGRGHQGESAFSAPPSSTAFLETVNWFTGRSSATSGSVAQSRRGFEPWQRGVAGTSSHPTH